MRMFLFLCSLFFILSCSKDKNVEGYYYRSEGYEIFKFDDEKSKIIHLRDSTVEPFNFKVWDDDVLELNEINYFHKNYGDSLILFDYYDRKLVLKKFDFEDIKINDLNDKKWIMHIKKTDDYYDTTYVESQIIHINDSLNAYYTQANDTILGATYHYSKKAFDEFSFFETSYNSYIILTKHNSKDLNILIMNGALNSTYSLNEINN